MRLFSFIWEGGREKKKIPIYNTNPSHTLFPIITSVFLSYEKGNWLPLRYEIPSKQFLRSENGVFVVLVYFSKRKEKKRKKEKEKREKEKKQFMCDHLYELERERIVAAGVETMPLPSRGRDAVVAASRSPEAWKKLALMSAKIFSAETSFIASNAAAAAAAAAANAASSSSNTNSNAVSTPSTSCTPSMTSPSPTSSTGVQQQTSPQSQNAEGALMSSMPSSPQAHSIFSEAAQYYQHQRHQYQTNDDYAAAMAYYRARILSIDNAAKAYVSTLNKPEKKSSSKSQSQPLSSSSNASSSSPSSSGSFMPMIHSLEVDAEDEAGVKPPYCEDVALDLSEYRWRISTRPYRLDLAKKRAEQESLPFPQRAALVRTSEAMGSYARLLAAARMEEKGTQIWTPPKEVLEEEAAEENAREAEREREKKEREREIELRKQRQSNIGVIPDVSGINPNFTTATVGSSSSGGGGGALYGYGNEGGYGEDGENGDDEEEEEEEEEEERPLSEVEMMGGYDYAPYLRREDREAMVSRIAFYPEITHQQSCVPDLPFPETVRVSALAGGSARAGLRVAVARILAAEGFEEAEERALDILADLTGTLMRRIGLNTRILADNNPQKYSNEFTLKRAWKGACDAGIPPRKVVFDVTRKRKEDKEKEMEKEMEKKSEEKKETEMEVEMKSEEKKEEKEMEKEMEKEVKEEEKEENKN